jgi:hypothetical protein
MHRLRIACWLLALAAAPALADPGVSIAISNNTTSNLLVTVYDKSTQPPEKVVPGQVINSFASILVSVGADGSGYGHVSWRAATVAPDMRRCAHHDRPHLNDGATVHVYANRRCGQSD